MISITMKGVIFDLDGVILSTDHYHYKAWKKMADEENIYFDENINMRLRGVSRMASLAVILEKSKKKYSNKEKEELAARKNNYYRESLKNLKPSEIFPGAIEFIDFLKQKNYKVAIGSSSKNTKFILEKVNLLNTFDAISDGTNIKKSKPDPEVFLKAARFIKLNPKECFVIEDADAGIEAGNRGKMKTIGVGAAMNNKAANYTFENIGKIDRKIF